MYELNIDKKVFQFKYLPPYAQFLAEHKLEDFVRVGIRFARQYDIPMMKPLSRISEKELVALSLTSNSEMLEAVAQNRLADYIEKNSRAWLENKLGVIDQHEVAAEDLVLAYYIRRKTFAHFLYEYSPNLTIHQLITAEVDTLTTQEELVNLKVFLHLHKKEFI